MVMVLLKEFEAGVISLRPGNPLVGLIPVFNTREEAEEEFPGKEIIKIGFVDIKEKKEAGS